MALNSVKGEFFRVYIDLTGAGTPDALIGCAQSFGLDISVDEVEEPLCSNDYTPGVQGIWKKTAPGDKSYSAEIEGLVIPTNSVNIQQFYNLLDQGTIFAFKVEVLDDVTPSPIPTILKTYSGNAWINSHGVSAANSEFATYSFKLKGYDTLLLA